MIVREEFLDAEALVPYVAFTVNRDAKAGSLGVQTKQELFWIHNGPLTDIRALHAATNVWGASLLTIRRFWGLV